MNSGSTFRTDLDGTIADPAAEQRRLELPQLVRAEWGRAGAPDLVESINRHPQLLRDRSILLNLAIDEYKERCLAHTRVDLEHYCARFHSFGSSIERSIFRQLETQRYIDEHPELLELFGEPTWPEPGEVFADCHVYEELGRGAIARVYLCRQSDVGNRSVVVKGFPFSSAEASVLGRLDHPNIIPILSIGGVEERNLHYLCMPFCGRSTLVDVLELAFSEATPRESGIILEASRRWTTRGDRLAHNGHVPPQCRAWCGTYVGGVVALAIEIAAGLRHAHEQGIVHGDIKPSNILLTPEGRPLLMDFNLSIDYTNAIGLCGGTLPYMPPEQLRQLQAGAESHDPATTFDPRADIYSFGALLYELLTGVTPVHVPRIYEDPSAAAEEALRQLKRGVPSIRQQNAQVSARLERLVMRCLAFDPADRFDSMAEIESALKTALRPAPTALRRIRSKPRKYATMLVLLAAVFSVVGIYWANLPPRHTVEFQRGQQAYASGDYNAAIAHYAAAASNVPELIAPRFELARSRLAAGEVDRAISEFQTLAQNHKHGPSMAYMGYCFTCKGQTVAAIPWYEKAIENGEDTVAVHNNLGASYLITRGSLSIDEQPEYITHHLKRALVMNENAIAVHLNLVRLAIFRSSRDEKYSPVTAAIHAEVALKGAPNNLVVRNEINRYLHTIRRYASTSDLVAKLQSLSKNTTEAEASKIDLLHTYYMAPL